MQRRPEAPSLAEPTTPALRLALSTAKRQSRDMLAGLFALDERLSRAVAATGEVMLAQIRFAWWRDELAKPPDAVAADPLLKTLRRSFAGDTSSLGKLVDGWEGALVADDSGTGREHFAAGRARAFELVAEMTGERAYVKEVGRAGRLWAFADLTTGIAGGKHAAGAAEGRYDDHPFSLPRSLRPIAVVGGLSRRALRHPGSPLLGDRLSPFVALRLGLLGR